MENGESSSLDEVLQKLLERRAAAQQEVENCDRAIEGLRLANKLVRTRQPRNRVQAEHGRLTEAVRKFVDRTDGEFTVDDVAKGLQAAKEELNGSLNRDSITKALRRMVKDDTVTEVQ